MGKIKITPEKFDEVKKYLSFASINETANACDISPSTAYKISKCPDYDEFLTYRGAERLVDEEGLTRLKSLEGEPLFWEVHSRFRRVALRVLKRYTNCSMQELYWMKKAEDYQSYLACKDSELKGAQILYDRPVTNYSIQQDIKEKHQNGVGVNELAEIYGLSYEDIQTILSRKDIPEESYRRKTHRHINSAIAKIIRYGKTHGASTKTMVKSLDVSAHTIWRVMRNVYDYNGTDITRERYEQGRLLPSDRKFHYPGENFYMFSLRKYCGLTECPEWCEEFVKGDTKTEEPEQKEASKDSTQIEESIQKEEEVPIRVKINKDGRNSTLTININLFS